MSNNDNANNYADDYHDYDDELNDFVILDSFKDINEIKNINQSKCTHIFLFDTNKYLDEILESYSYNPENILEQVAVDFCRTNIFSNNKYVKTINDFLNIYDKFNSHTYFTKNKEYNFLTILLMLCCQSSYGLHYASLREIYCESKDNLLLCSSNENRKSCFVIDDNILSVTIETNLIIKDIINNINIKKINTKIIIDSYLCKKNQTFNEHGLFYWSITD